MKNLNIVSLSRKKIVYRYPKKEERKSWAFTIASFVLVVLSALVLMLTLNSSNVEVFETLGKVYNPSTPLYKEMNDIVFTDGELVADLPAITVNGGVVSWNL